MKHMILKTMAAAFVVAGQMSATEVAQVKEYSFLPGYVYGFDGEKYVSVGKDVSCQAAESCPPQYSYSHNGMNCRQYGALTRLAPIGLGGALLPLVDEASAFYVIADKRVEQGDSHDFCFLPGYVYGFDGEKYVRVGEAKDVKEEGHGNNPSVRSYTYDGRSCEQCGAMREYAMYGFGPGAGASLWCHWRSCVFYVIKGQYVPRQAPKILDRGFPANARGFDA